MTPAPDISFIVREYIRERLVDASTGFNFFIIQTAATYDVASFQLKTGPGDCDDTNLFIGRFPEAVLVLSLGKERYPRACMSVAKEDNIARFNLQVTPSEFSGAVIVSIEFSVAYQGSFPPENGDAYFNAIGDALVATFNTPDAYSLTPPGVGYNNQIAVEAGPMGYDNTRWLQQVVATMMFTRIA